MKKQFFHVLALVLALTMCFAMALPVLAAGEGSKYEPNTDGEVFFDKDLIMPKDATVPDVKFTFTLAEHDTIGKDGKSLQGAVYQGWEIHKGIFDLKSTLDEDQNTAANKPVKGSNYSVTFDASHATTAGGIEGNTILDDANKKYATESFSIDFSMIDYKEPGIYRYTVTEDVPEAAKEDNEYTVNGIKYNKKTFYVDVYVENDENGKPKIADVIVSEDDNLDGSEVKDDGTIDPPTPGPGEDPDPGKIPAGGGDNKEEGEGDEPPTGPVPPKDPDPDDDPNDTTNPEKPNAGLSKADFKNEYTPLSLVVVKNVSGTQASRVADFTFTLTIDLTNVDKVGTKLSDGAYAIVYSQNANKNTEYIVVRGGTTGTITVKLKADESFTILLPYNAKYTITEAKAAGYSTAVTTNASNVETIMKWDQGDWDIAADLEGTEPKKPDPESDDYENGEDDEQYQADLKDYNEKKEKYDAVAALAGVVNEDNKAENTMTANATVTYVNFKDGITPTGILLAIAPFAILMVVAVVGGVIVLKKKKEN